jgi:hypothetical protein
MRWLTPAIVGDGAARIGAAVKLSWAFAAAQFATLIGTKARLSVAFRNYVAALIDHQRLEYINSKRRARAKTAGNPQGDPAAGWDVFAPENAGFHPIEMSHGAKFRWSETAAIMPAWIPAGRHHIRIEYLPVRSLMHGVNLQFYLNERPLSAQDISIGPDTIEIKLDLAQSSHSTLAWTCPPFPATGDQRWLGLPVKRVVWNPARHRPLGRWPQAPNTEPRPTKTC